MTDWANEIAKSLHIEAKDKVAAKTYEDLLKWALTKDETTRSKINNAIDKTIEDELQKLLYGHGIYKSPWKR